MKNFLIFLIKTYQHLLRPSRAVVRCKYLPTCSDYAVQAIEKHGVVKGVLMGAWRIMRCNPIVKGGVDLP